MKALFTAAAVVCAIATTASAAPSATPYVLSAAHEDFLMQLEDAAGVPGQIGTAARAAADLLRRHNETEEAVVLPLLGFAETAVSGTMTSWPARGTMDLRAELAGILGGQEEVVIALVELFAAAQQQDRSDISRLAERVVWHETGDAEILYPAAILVSSGVERDMDEASPSDGAGSTEDTLRQ
ncbi:hypothetical protein [Nitratireductor sp. ZSWI3]|uniref:hypothetical protein n=1 Tax=Nitratireductor sp. ZSWI3 TaxID=2966359 RepID=UPI00214FB3E2|nr:hypothetical protein [Nitratireductor sp. ZSWI3]MCR4267055.1 hypothetical protein [Nitratireductor sp. ZSWI3]